MLSKSALRLQPLLRRARPVRPPGSAFLSTAPPVPDAGEGEQPTTAVVGNRILFEGSQTLQIRAMMSAAVLNCGWWSYFMVDYWLNKDIVVGGINGEETFSMVASPWFGAAGAIGTVAIVFVTRMYSRNAISQIYESADGQRLGFQMHNMVGNPGRRFEVPIGNARFSNLKISSFSKDMIALKIQGVPNNCVMDKDGEFHDPERLRALLTTEKKNQTDSKEHRVAWKKAAARHQHGSKH